VLIVDDNSPTAPGTSPTAWRPKITACTSSTGRKVRSGDGVHTRIQMAIVNQYDYIFEMDADFSHDPDYLPTSLTPSKTMTWCSDRATSAASTSSTGRCPAASVVLRQRLFPAGDRSAGVDATGGFKCFRREVLEAIDLDQVRSNGYAFQIEVSMRAWVRGFRIKEIPIVFTDRQHGASKMSKKMSARRSGWSGGCVGCRSETSSDVYPSGDF